MYIIIPLGIIGVCVVGIGIVALRKISYLKKLDPLAVHDAPVTIKDFGRELFPEAETAWRNISSRERITFLLQEAEKILRKIRLAFMKIDTLTQVIIKKLRKKAQQTPAPVATEEQVQPVVPQINPRELEQELIMEIAKNPKNALSYKRLGDVYVLLREYGDARQSFEKALELNPEDVLIKNRLRNLPE